jgi:hypothetical protein
MLATIATARGPALLLTAACGLMLLAHTAPAAAEEQTLRFKLVARSLGKPAELPEIGGHKVSANEYTGVAVFEDGRIAYKRFVEMDDVRAMSAPSRATARTPSRPATRSPSATPAVGTPRA